MVTIIPPQPEYNRFAIPESIRKDEKFEDFVLKTLFSSDIYTLLDRSKGLKLRDNISGIEFYIQCKHRFSLITNNLSFSASPHLSTAESKTNIFLVLGLGGSAEHPYEVFVINFEDCPSKHLFKRHLKNKSVNVTQPLSSALLWKDILPLKVKAKKRA